MAAEISRFGGLRGKIRMAPPVAVIIILLSLQITSRKQWSFWIYDYFLMTIECVLLAVPLIVLTMFISSAGSRYMHHKSSESSEAQVWSQPVCAAVNNPDTNTPDSSQYGTILKKNVMANIVTGIGAGIYEEFVFRLILICLLIVIFQDLIGWII